MPVEKPEQEGLQKRPRFAGSFFSVYRFTPKLDLLQLELEALALKYE